MYNSDGDYLIGEYFIFEKNSNLCLVLLEQIYVA